MSGNPSQPSVTKSAPAGKTASPGGSRKSSVASKGAPSSASVASAAVKKDDYYENCQEPDFIYGGPFIHVQKPEPFLDTTTPINIQLQGTFKKSFAYYSLKERLPVILTKVIDYVSREEGSIKAKHGATEQDTKNFISYIAKLKNDLITNKKYDLLTVDTDDAQLWNKYIEACDMPHYFTNNWCFTECYVYRRLREGCELSGNLVNFDPFAAQKEDSFQLSLEPMCLVAEKVLTMLEPSEKDKRKADLISLLKVCLWSNKCDMSLSLGEPVALPPPSPPPSPPPPGAGKGASPPPPPPPPSAAAPAGEKPPEGDKPPEEPGPPPPQPAIDPFQLILEFKDKLLVDDTNKIADQVIIKAENMAKAIENEQLEQARIAAALAAELKAKGKGKGKKPPPTPPAPPPEPVEGEPPPPPPVPCPAKVTVPSAVQFDIVCDNAGYELFTDLCLAHFLVSQQIVQKVRFHVKAIPWFVSDVTPNDFKYLIEACTKASYSRTVPPPEPKPAAAEGSPEPAPEPPRNISSDALRSLGARWAALVDNGTFVVMNEDYWVGPHVFKDMKKYDYWMYRKLQFACTILFKGDLNYRKLVGERNCNPVASFESSLQGFIPAPIIALRTVKSDLICGLPRGKFDAITKLDAHWMRKGDYGVIQFCAKAESLKVADRPCSHYCYQCMGLSCPEEGAFW